jgi:hypothetical protein
MCVTTKSQTGGQTHGQQTADSRQQTADSTQQTADSRQQTADSRQQTAHKDSEPSHGDVWWYQCSLLCYKVIQSPCHGLANA